MKAAVGACFQPLQAHAFELMGRISILCDCEGGANIGKSWSLVATAVSGAAHNRQGLVVATAPARLSAQSWQVHP